MKVDISKFEITNAHMNLSITVDQEDVDSLPDYQSDTRISDEHPLSWLVKLNDAYIRGEPVELLGTNFDIQAITNSGRIKHNGTGKKIIQYHFTLRQKRERP